MNDFFFKRKKITQGFFVTSDLYFGSNKVSIEHLEFVMHIYLFLFLSSLLLILYFTTVSHLFTLVQLIGNNKYAMLLFACFFIY